MLRRGRASALILCCVACSPEPAPASTVPPVDPPIDLPTTQPPASPAAPTPAPKSPDGPLKIQRLASGGSHVCLLLSDETVRCFGANDDGQLGTDGPASVRTPTAVPGLVGVTALALGDDFSCALLSGSGAVQCWGSDAFGQLGGGSVTGAPRRVPAPVTGLGGISAIAAGNWHAAALRSAGQILFWGRNNVGQFGDGDDAPQEVGAPTISPTLPALEVVALGGFHGCGITSERTVRCWGWNEWGQIGDGTAGKTATRTTSVLVDGLADVKQLALGENHSCALLGDGGVRCWGSNEYGQLGSGGKDSPKPVAVKDLTDVADLVAGGYHTCALRTDASVRCWGWNQAAQLGDGTTKHRRTPILVPDPLPRAVKQLVAGREHTCALADDDTLWCWGRFGSHKPTLIPLDAPAP